jgi:phenylalanyl-tRNA synthetase beta chain
VGAVNCLRRTLIPSLLEAKRINEHRANTDVNLYETANVYLPHDGPLPTEPLMLGLVSGRSFFNLKGVIEAIIREVDPAIRFEFRASELEILDISQSATVWVNNEIIGHIGQVTASGLKQFRLKQMTTVAELDLSQLGKLMVNVRRHQPVSEFPAVTRDFNFVMDEQVAWDRVEALVRDQAGHLLETISFREIFRNEKRDGANKKRVLLSIQLRSSESTLSGPEVESICTSVVEHCGRELGAVLAS